MYDVLTRAYISEDEDDEIIEHYGMPRRSGRYPWGSGGDPYQHGSMDFINRVDGYKKKGFSEVEIANAMGVSTGQLRAKLRVAKDDRRRYWIDTAQSLKARGLNPTEIGRKMNLNESSVRHLLDEHTSVRTDQVMNTAKFLEDQVNKKGTIDVGEGVENELNISATMKKQVFEVMENDGYPVRSFRTPQVTNKGQYTTVTVATKPIKNLSDDPSTANKQIYHKIYTDRDQGKIYSVNEFYSKDGGLTFESPLPPASVNSKRVAIRYAEDGGKDKDGLIELRPGVKDLNLGRSKYAQVRIGVDGTHYLKGMCIYGDPEEFKNFPEGTDIIFNTNKGKDKTKLDVLKAMKTVEDDNGNKVVDKLDPFGAAIMRKGQSTYTDDKGKEQLSPINKLHSEGEWSTYSKQLPAQFLAKQPLKLVTSQLNLAKAEKNDEYDEIMSLTNPTLRKHYLENFASECDRAAVDLKAAALPEQKYQVLIPIPDLKDNEIYAPQYKDGEKLALVRFPHGGTFEIPVLKNNLKSKVGKSTLADALDAVGINSDVAGRLSGADFDGDDALVIPTDNGKIKIKHDDPLPGLKGFDTNIYAVKEEDQYDRVKNPKGIRKITPKYKQNQMGQVSNLITDMTVIGAEPEELERAVRHSMVVIDSEKHYLDYRKSYKDNNIAELKQKYQGIKKDNGRLSTAAATLLSRSKNRTDIPDTEKYVKINKKGDKDYDPSKPEGALLYKIKSDERLYYDKREKDANGNYVVTTAHTMRTKQSNQMRDTEDARLLMSGKDHHGTPVEEAYADYANAMKALANKARKEMIYTPPLKQSATAKITYAKEVESIKEKLNEALKNAPRERRAQIIAGSALKAKIAQDPSIADDKDTLKKISNKYLKAAREEVGSSSKNTRIKLTQEEWNAIQAGAISDHKLIQILNNTDADILREYAMPKEKVALSKGKISRIKNMKASGFTMREIAEACSISVSAVSNVLNPKQED